MGKKVFFMLVILLIASVETTHMMVRGVVLCDVPELNCMFKCYKGSGKCLRCCQDLGLVHGYCSLFRWDLCYCCKNYTDIAGSTHHRQQLQTDAPTPTPHFLYA
nr:uncharacterized protein LOC127320898 isoform X1 [Lolium perenne]XP_051205936.1 uncharacterized protein LOC127320898 isoform X2 [Lolium perenne]